MAVTEISGALTKRERLCRAIRGQSVDRRPVWMMRQAGRYLPQYREVRKRFDFLTMCREPEAAAEVSLQPLEILDVDAVIVFNDILIPLEAMGAPVVFTEQGPELTAPLRDRQNLAHFKPADFDAHEPVSRTLRLLRERIGPDVALLGFAGAPLTMACYAVEGKLSRNLDVVKAMRYRDPALLHTVLGRIAETVVNYLRIQIEAGADMVQLFDTWAGMFSVADYREFAVPCQRRIIESLRPLGVPIALYVKGSAPMLEAMAESGADVLSVDWTLPLSEVRRRVGGGFALQGNLDSTALLATPECVRREVRAMLEDFAGDGRHIVNLGHGILPNTPVECAQAFVEAVREFRP
jgi:uroporphyrinogen decarboxylase